MFDVVHSLLSSQKQSNTETVRTQNRVSTNREGSYSSGKRIPVLCLRN